MPSKLNSPFISSCKFQATYLQFNKAYLVIDGQKFLYPGYRRNRSQGDDAGKRHSSGTPGRDKGTNASV